MPIYQYIGRQAVQSTIMGAFGHISADVRLHAWKFELPQSHPFHRHVDIDRIGILHQVLSQHDKSHHAKSTQLKSDGSNLVRKGLKRGLNQSRNRYWPLSIYWHYIAKVLCYHIGQSLSTYVLPIYWSYWLLVGINSTP